VTFCSLSITVPTHEFIYLKKKVTGDRQLNGGNIWRFAVRDRAIKTSDLFLCNCRPLRIDHTIERPTTRNSTRPLKPEVLISPAVIDVIDITKKTTETTGFRQRRARGSDSNNDHQPEMAAKTGSSYIDETVRDNIEIPTDFRPYESFAK